MLLLEGRLAIIEMTVFNNWFDSIEPKGLRFFWLSGTSAGIAFFLILLKILLQGTILYKIFFR